MATGRAQSGPFWETAWANAQGLKGLGVWTEAWAAFFARDHSIYIYILAIYGMGGIRPRIPENK